MKQGIAIVGASETARLGQIPEQSQIGLSADAALRALADAGLAARDVMALPPPVNHRRCWRIISA